jgi:hypothetical protein
MIRLFRIVVEFPALDRLIDYLTGLQQHAVDVQTERLRGLSDRLKASNDKLQQNIEKGN